jgi:putative membrane protein
MLAVTTFLSQASAVPEYADPWAFNAHPEIWILVAFFTGAYIYMARVIGPRAVPAGQQPVTRRQVSYFVGAMALFWFAADWPVHDIGEGYLYSVHMFQHMVFSYFVPPLALMSIPTWMAKTLIGDGRTYRVFKFLSTAVIAGVIFNMVVMILHIPGLVNASTENGPLHYGLHLLVVTTALLMWCPVVGPFEDLRLSHLGKCIYLFLMSVVPTVPAGWLTFAEGTVYKHYNQPVRVWGLSPTEDQQIAGAIMKIGGGFFLWSIVIFLFFKRFSKNFEQDNTYLRTRRIPTAEITGNDEQPLTFDEVQAAFERTPPAQPVGSESLESEQTTRDER